MNWFVHSFAIRGRYTKDLLPRSVTSQELKIFTVDGPYSLAGPLLVSDQSWMADVLLGASAYETRLLVQRGIMQRTGCALAGPRCLPEQPSLCRWSLFLQHYSPLSCCPAFSFSLNCTQNSVLHSAIKSFLGKPLSAQKSVGKGHSLDTQEPKRRLQHPCTFMSGLSSPGFSWSFTSSLSLLMFEHHL